MGRKVWVPAVSGPLAAFAAGYGSWLRAQCYSRSAISDRLWQFDQLSRWLDREGLAVGEVNAAECERFAASRRATGRVTLVAPQSMTLPEEYLRELGVTPEPVPPLAHGPVEELLGDYSGYLLIERGLSPHTVFDAYVPAARLFLAGRDGLGGLRLDRLAAADVSMFLARECANRSVSGTRDLVSALRSFLRYLHLVGRIEAPLVWALPSVADLRDRTLPRGLKPSAVKRLLASCDRRRLVGRRPRCSSRAVFVRVTAPRRVLNRSTIGWVVRAACDRAGLPRVGAHRLRHTAATEMLRHGASLAEIGEVLRHREQKTTAIYAKVDRDALRPLARPWPAPVGAP